MNLTTHLHLVQRLRVSGATFYLPYVSLWCGQKELHFFSTYFVTNEVSNYVREPAKSSPADIKDQQQASS
jgi:hypothetical protein